MFKYLKMCQIYVCRADALYWEIVCVLCLPTLAICSSNYGDFEQMNLTTQPL